MSSEEDADALLASGRALLLTVPVPSVFLRVVHTDDTTVFRNADLCFIPSLCCVNARRAGALGSSFPFPRVTLYVTCHLSAGNCISLLRKKSRHDWPEPVFDSMCTQLNMSQFCCFHESLTQHHGFCDIAVGSHPRQPPRLLPWWHGAPSTTPLINCPNVS